MKFNEIGLDKALLFFRRSAYGPIVGVNLSLAGLECYLNEL
jgi:hypothetical protein